MNTHTHENTGCPNAEYLPLRFFKKQYTVGVCVCVLVGGSILLIEGCGYYTSQPPIRNTLKHTQFWILFPVDWLDTSQCVSEAHVVPSRLLTESLLYLSHVLSWCTGHYWICNMRSPLASALLCLCTCTVVIHVLMIKPTTHTSLLRSAPPPQHRLPLTHPLPTHTGLDYNSLIPLSSLMGKMGQPTLTCSYILIV